MNAGALAGIRWCARGITGCGVVVVLALGGAQASGPETQVVLVANDGKTVFEFETERIKGTIRADGEYHGVSRLTDKRTGKEVIDPRYAALNLFKLMSVNQVMGLPRRMERVTRAGADYVELEWGAAEGHDGVVTARYEVRRPDAIDLAITVRSAGTYRDHEVFLSSYFDKEMRPHVYLQPRQKSKNPPELVLPTFNEVFKDTLLVFPRDAHAARVCLDGRWDRGEGNVPTIAPSPVRRYAHCLAFMVSPEKDAAVVLMARPRDCLAISTRYFSEEDANRQTSYSAFDLALFGGDMLPGDARTVRVRLAVTDLDAEFSQPLDLYRSFVDEVEPAGAALQPYESTGASP